MITLTALTEEKRTPKNNGQNELPLYMHGSEKLVRS